MEFVSDIKTLDIFENVFAFYGTLTAEGFVLNLEGKIFEQTSTDPQFLIGQKFSETVYWQSSEHTPNILEQSISKAAKGERSKTLLDFRVNSQEKVVIELFLHPLPETKYNPKQIFFCAQDVTEREKKIEHYKTRNEHLLLAAESAEIGLWFWELTEDKIFSTPKCNELLEIPIDNVITIESLLHIVHPEDLALVEAALRDSQLNGKEFHAEYRVIYSDGSIHWISARGKTYLDDEGNPKNMMGVVRKVTDQRHLGLGKNFTNKGSR
ncbi:MAG: PAS domain-containing protein [Acidobacteria bacterium]|nr:PAS domain-containing protein [Acidobacteriota bacterium]